MANALANDYDALRGYVLGGEQTKQEAPEGQVRLEITTQALGQTPESATNNWKNFPLTLTILQFKQKLEMFSGTPPQFMKLQLYADEGFKLVADLSDDAATLESYNAQSGMRIFVIDEDPSNNVRNLQDTSQVPKYVMSDEDYAKRETNYKKWKEEQAQSTPQKKKEEEAAPQNIKVGDRCEAETLGGEMKRRGTVKYIGKIDGSDGYWVGIQLDEPLGKNDGSAKGKRYFSCPDKYGVFVRPNKVTVGDFPEEEISLDD